MDPNTGYSLILIIFWSVMTILWAFYFYSVCVCIAIVWYLTTLYFKYKFNEINDSFINSHKIRNQNLFLKDIENHNRVAIVINKLNINLSKVIFVVYYMVTPCIQLIFYCSNEKITKPYVSFALLLITFVFFSMIFLMNLLSANVIHSAHKPYRLLYGFLLKNRLKLREQFEIQTFIEQLSSSIIGFHCLNMFPMNNYHFYRFLTLCILNYLLIMDIF